MKNKTIFLILISFLLSVFIVADFQSDRESKETIISADNPEYDVSLDQNKQKKKVVTVYITRTGKKYHRGSCRYLKKSKIKTTLKDACARGFTPCKVCKPPACSSL